MKTIILAAVAALGLTAATAQMASAASTVAGDTAATKFQQTGSYGQ